MDSNLYKNKLEKINQAMVLADKNLQEIKKLIKKKNLDWIAYKDFLKIVNIKPNDVHNRVRRGEWFNGYVVKKEGIFFKYACLEHYNHWINNKNPKRVIK